MKITSKDEDVCLLLLCTGTKELLATNTLFLSKAEFEAVKRLATDPSSNILGIDWAKVLARSQMSSWPKDDASIA